MLPQFFRIVQRSKSVRVSDTQDYRLPPHLLLSHKHVGARRLEDVPRPEIRGWLYLAKEERPLTSPIPARPSLEQELTHLAEQNIVFSLHKISMQCRELSKLLLVKSTFRPQDYVNL